MEKIIESFLGTFLGFIFGIISFFFKELIDHKKREALFVANLRYFLKNLNDYLNQDPEDIPDFDIKFIISYSDIGFYTAEYTKQFQDLFSVYMDWKRGLYMPNGANYKVLLKTQNQITAIEKELSSYKSNKLNFINRITNPTISSKA